MASHGTQGGSHDQHIEAGKQSHKNAPVRQGETTKQASTSDKPAKGSSHGQQSKVGLQSHKNTSSKH